jgi:hypothetical protein
VHLAEPAATRLGQDRKRRAKTDKLDARLLREMLVAERLGPPVAMDQERTISV